MNTRRIFVTGGSGFVGRTLLHELGRIEELEVIALDRSGSIASNGRLTTVRGNLLEPDSYRTALSSCDAVVHLAAATGKASAETHMRETAVGTEVLVSACQSAGIQRFLHVSSIAAAFPDKRGYPYAVAKERAERAVTGSGLRYAILRPTMIFGTGSPVLASLEKLAMLPFIVVPGSGSARVQPIADVDVVRAMMAVLHNDAFESETWEIGGPEVLTMESLLQRIRASRTGRPGRVLRMPLGLIQAPLAVAEKIGLRALLPATAGQLTSFRHDGVASANPLQDFLAPDMVPLETQLASAQPVSRQTDAIEAECRAFTRHLIGADADDAIIRIYRSAVDTLPALRAAGPWDRPMDALARRGVWGVRCADSFAGWFARSSAFRKRLVILLAILETRAPYSGLIDRSSGGSVPGAIAALTLRGAWSVLHLVAGALLLVPMRVALGSSHEAAR